MRFVARPAIPIAANPLLHQLINTLQSHLSHAPIDIHLHLSHCTLDIIGSAGLGYELGAMADDEENELARAYRTMLPAELVGC